MAIDPKIQAQIDALNAAFMQARGGGNDFRTRMPDLSPEMVAFLSSLQGERDSGGNGLLKTFIDPSGANFHQYGNYATTGQGESQAMNFDPNLVNWSQSPFQFGVNGDTSNYLANFDPQGHFTGYELATDNNNWRDFITAMVMMAPAIAGVYGAAGAAGGEGGAAAGMGGAEAAGGGAGGLGATDWASWAANEGSGALAGSGYTGAAFNAGELAAGAGAGAGGAGTNWADWAANEGSNSLSGSGYAGSDFNAGELAAGQSGANVMRQGEISNYQSDPNAATKAATTSGNMTDFDRWWEGLKQAVGTGAGSDQAGWTNAALKFLGNNSGALLGGLASYLDSKDGKTNSTQVEPWKPAQPYLEGLLREGATLYDQYKRQPFSPAEQTAYGNYGNVLDYINGNAGGLLSGFQANASGANQFVRGQPKQLIGAGYDPNNPVVPWLPQRYGNFGTGGK